jgi:hypothetical protein
MIVRKLSVCLFLVGLMIVGLAVRPAGAAQPSYDTLRVDGPVQAMPYQVWVAWTPSIIPLPDGGAWAFFSAEIVNPDGTIGTKKLYASRLDPAAGTWRPATAFNGGEIQFGQSAVVDSQGTVHIVFTDRANDDETSYGQLVYARSTPEGGWTDPVAIAPDQSAGHQLSPELILDRNGGLHVVWQDQRLVDQASREAAASNADIFASNLGADGAWTAPVQINIRPTATDTGTPTPDVTTNASRPQLGVDGDRLVVVWSVYTAASGLDTAERLEWSTQPIDGSSGWAAPQVLLERGESQIGGRLLDVASDPNGGVALVFGSRTSDINLIFSQRLQPGATAWDAAVLIASGDRGSFPSATIAPDGTVVVAYNVGSGTSVQVGAVAYVAGQPRGSIETILTAGEDGAQGRPMILIDANGRMWVIYMHEPAGGIANEVRVIRGATISIETAPEQLPATPEPAASPAA